MLCDDLEGCDGVGGLGGKIMREGDIYIYVCVCVCVCVGVCMHI